MTGAARPGRRAWLPSVLLRAVALVILLGGSGPVLTTSVRTETASAASNATNADSSSSSTSSAL